MTKVGLIVAGIIMLIIGALIVANDQPKVNAIESLVGGWAVVSPEYNAMVQELMIGYVLALIGIIMLVVGIVLSRESKKTSLTCTYCNFIGLSEGEILKHYSENHLDKSPFKCAHCDFIGFTEQILWSHYDDKHPDKKKVDTWD